MSYGVAATAKRLDICIYAFALLWNAAPCMDATSAARVPRLHLLYHTALRQPQSGSTYVYMPSPCFGTPRLVWTQHLRRECLACICCVIRRCIGDSVISPYAHTAKRLMFVTFVICCEEEEYPCTSFAETGRLVRALTVHGEAASEHREEGHRLGKTRRCGRYPAVMARHDMSDAS